MKDLITALMGKKHCEWCTLKEPTKWERLMRFDQIVPKNEYKWYEKIAMKWEWFNTCFLRVWVLGEKFHYRFHVKENDDVVV